ncbi:MAG: 2-C-methyl-D-erythritol 2,4-cyclodiphosphate synthase [Spirochaetota bacterium]
MTIENNDDTFDYTRLRIGSGVDVHPFREGRELWLGGVNIQHPMGLLGHSDADVLTHAIIDAILGAAGFGDIGSMFPDSDTVYKGISSIELLTRAWKRCREHGMRLINIDVTLACENPIIMPHAEKMRLCLSSALNLSDPRLISIKATTTEKLGFIGREEGIAAHAVVLMYR